MMKNINN